MLRRLTPFLATFIAVMLDTAILPVFYHGVYTVPLTIVVVMCVGLIEGRLMGLLLGMIGGLLIDISAGILGTMTFFFMAAGFLIGLIVDEANDRPITGLRFHLRRAVVAFALYMLGEIVLCIYRYFVSASFEWYYLRPMFIRGGMIALLTVLLCPLLARLFRGKKTNRYARKRREVKHF